MTFIDRIQARLADGWQSAHRWASIRISAVGMTLFSILSIFPGAIVEAWGAIAPTVSLPSNVVNIVGLLLFAAVIVGRLHQSKGEANDND